MSLAATTEREHQARNSRTKSYNRPSQQSCHRPRDSLFSWSSGFDNFTGFINWGFLLLGIGGVRLLLENFIKYGIRVNPREWFFFLSGKNDGGEESPSILLICYSMVPVMLCLLIEKGLALNIIAHNPGIIFHVVNIIVMVLMPMVVIHVKDSGFSLIGAVYVCMLYAILFFKLWSYVQVNMWCRKSDKKTSISQGRMRRQSFSYSSFKSSAEHNELEFDDLPSHDDDDDKLTKSLVQYPNNLHIRDLVYFIFAPTLCYELNFPRTERIRKRFLMKRIFEVFVGCQVIMSLCQQWMIPSVKNSLIPFTNMDVAKASERLLKLAIVV
ncbi:hypothetical protein PV327_009548 [Microctonus hyperodae]|uniref:diacylglycerol O-acyltransferase n=1 Tax=Microctonus hyperodae TaxID=165561 RepID=A0AA39CBJ0_MICHY|nr:hypothetical protein PV327_009548 [Microctonus hyperodae]